MYAVHDEICVCVCVFYTREHENAAYFRYYLKNKISLLVAVIVFCPNKNCDGLSRVHTHTHTHTSKTLRCASHIRHKFVLRGRKCACVCLWTWCSRRITEPHKYFRRIFTHTHGTDESAVDFSRRDILLYFRVVYVSTSFGFYMNTMRTCKPMAENRD